MEPEESTFESAAQQWAAGVGGNLQQPSGRLLIQVPVLAAAGLGLAFGLTRFVLTLRDNLNDTDVNWEGFLLLSLIVGSVAMLIALASAGAGLLIGLLLKTAYLRWEAGLRRYQAHL